MSALYPLELNETMLLKYPLAECPCNTENLDVAKSLKEWIEERNKKHHDCSAICTSQLGIQTRALAFFSNQDEIIRCWLNPFITDTGRMLDDETQVSVLSYPNSYVLIPNAHMKCTVSFDDERGIPSTYDAVGNEALLLQVLCLMLDGIPLKVVPRNYRTIIGKTSKNPNDICVMCGKKIKKCSCGG